MHFEDTANSSQMIETFLVRVATEIKTKRAGISAKKRIADKNIISIISERNGGKFDGHFLELMEGIGASLQVVREIVIVLRRSQRHFQFEALAISNTGKHVNKNNGIGWYHCKGGVPGCFYHRRIVNF